MIVIEEEQGLLKVHVYGELTLDDFGEFERVISDKLKRFPQVDVLMDLSNMTGFTLDVAWEDIRFNHQHVRDIKRIAVVAGDQWLSWLGWLSGVSMQAEVQVFPEIADAEAWLEQG